MPASGGSIAPKRHFTKEHFESSLHGRTAGPAPGKGPVRRRLTAGRTERRWPNDPQPGRASPHSHQPSTRGAPGRYIVSTASMTRPAAAIDAVTRRVR